jgi:hypothetical protein
MKSCLPLVFGWRYAGWYLQLSNVKPTQVRNAEAGRRAILTTLRHLIIILLSGINYLLFIYL